MEKAEKVENAKKIILEVLKDRPVACSWDTPENFVSGFGDYQKNLKSYPIELYQTYNELYENDEFWKSCSKIVSSKVHTQDKNSKEHVVQGYSNIIIDNNLNDDLDVEDFLENMVNSTAWNCKGCKKYFASKQSLHRHYDRKKSCREISGILNETKDEKINKDEEEKETIIKSLNEIPEKPYIIDYVDELLVKAISGDTEKPYCKHCDVEFANKSNLHKHLSKNIACDKLAKQELKLLFK